MDGFEKREREEPLMQTYVVAEDRGWVQDGAYGARLIVVAPIGGTGHAPEVQDVLAATGKKHDARSELDPRPGYRSGDEAQPKPGDPPAHMGHGSNHPH